MNHLNRSVAGPEDSLCPGPLLRAEHETGISAARERATEAHRNPLAQERPGQAQCQQKRLELGRGVWLLLVLADKAQKQ